MESSEGGNGLWTNRYVALVASLVIEFAAGTAYAYGSYSAQFKDPPYDWKQSAVNQISAIGNCGMYFGILGGIFHDRYGAKNTCLVGAMLTFVGYALAWMNSKDDLGRASSGIMTACFVIAWQGSAWLDCAAISLTVKNFPHNRGLVLGLCKTFFGLSGSILGQLYVGLHLKHGSSTFGHMPVLLFMAFVVLATSLLVVPFMRPSDVNAIIGLQGRRSVLYGYCVVIVLAAFLSAAGLSEKLGSGVSDDVELIFSSITVLMVLALWGIPVLRFWRGDESESDEVRAILVRNSDSTSLDGAGGTFAALSGEDNDIEDSAPALDQTLVPLDGAVRDPKDHRGGGGDERDATLLDALQDVNYWLLAFAAFSHTGAGLMVINNIAQIAQAIQGHKDDSIGSLFVIIIGTVNAYGRMAAGYSSDTFVDRVNRPTLLCGALFAMAAGCCLFAFSTYEMLFIAAPVCAFAYGCYWSLAPAILADLYGAASFGTIYNTLAFATAAGGLSLNAGLASYFYDMHAADDNGNSDDDDDDGSAKCYGTRCYKPTFLICASLCVAAGAGLVLLNTRMSNIYASRRGRKGR